MITNTTGHEQSGNRPCIIVSNDINNKHSFVVEVVFLTTKRKPLLPTHVRICSTYYNSTALCEQVTSIDKRRFLSYAGEVTEEEMRKIDEAIKISLGIKEEKKEKDMNNELMFFEGHEVEVFEHEGKVLFNPYHVAKCLELTDSAVRKAIGNMNQKQVIKLTNSDVKKSDIRKLNNAGENFLTESGVYKLVFKSNKKNAEKFTDWIADEVLPSIRETGTYTTTTYQYPLSPATFEGVANLSRVLERIMKSEGSQPHEIALVVKSLCQQSGIELLDCFVKIPTYEQLSFMPDSYNDIITRV